MKGVGARDGYQIDEDELRYLRGEWWGDLGGNQVDTTTSQQLNILKVEDWRGEMDIT